MKESKLLTILGHTAGGKTSLAAHAALMLDAEIISADSRQVYRGMDLGTGKDLADYRVSGRDIPFHLIDIVDAGYEYSVFEFQRDFAAAFNDITTRGRLPLMCGGSGLYIESVLRKYRMINVPVNEELRENLEKKSLEELIGILRSYGPIHNSTDTESRKRAVRAIEIEKYQNEHELDLPDLPEFKSVVVGLSYERDERRSRITTRLHQRLEEGMVHEVRTLLEEGLEPGKLEYYGLEYKYLTLYITGRISYDEMLSQLNTAIHRFSKRQMTYFRGMEKRGTEIHWLDGEMTMDKKLEQIRKWYSAI